MGNKQKNANQQVGNQIINQNQKSSNVKQINQIKPLYPRGEQHLLKKIKGSTSIQDKLRRKVELFISLVQIPSAGKYSVDLFIKERQLREKLASIQQQESNLDNQVIFTSCIEMYYFFERDQTLEIVIRDSFNNQTIINEKVAKVASSLKNNLVLQSNSYSVELRMISLAPKAKQTDLSIELLESNKNIANLQHPVIGNNKDIFYVIYNNNDNQTWRPIYKSEESKRFSFNSVNLNNMDLCLDDESKLFKIEIFEFGNNVPLYFNTFSINMINQSQGIIPLKHCLLNQPQNSDVLVKVNMRVNEKLDFMALIKSGLEISLLVGIDFTGSNGHPLDQFSLHNIHKREANQYEKAIRACGNILAYYDSDQKFPLYGFGGVPQGQYDVNHSFALTFTNDPMVNSIDEMIDVYKMALTRTELSGPTYFSPLLNNILNLVRQQSTLNTYFVILIITDGIICDLQETIDAIVNLSFLPVSIIIIGVGSADFSAMEDLDGDTVKLKSSKGLLCERDIVQFVPFLKYERDSSRLAEEVLMELPDQIEQYYKKRPLNIKK